MPYTMCAPHSMCSLRALDVWQTTRCIAFVNAGKHAQARKRTHLVRHERATPFLKREA